MSFRFNSENLSVDSRQKNKEKEQTEITPKKYDIDDEVYDHALKANILRVNALITKGASKEWAFEGYLLGGHINNVLNLVEVTSDLGLREMIEEEKNKLRKFVGEAVLRESEKNILTKVTTVSLYHLFFSSLAVQKPYWEVREEEAIKKIQMEIKC